eukprot:m51a1_g9936 putative peptidase c14 (4927) ;mRNA; r:73913-115619
MVFIEIKLNRTAIFYLCHGTHIIMKFGIDGSSKRKRPLSETAPSHVDNEKGEKRQATISVLTRENGMLNLGVATSTANWSWPMVIKLMAMCATTEPMCTTTEPLITSLLKGGGTAAWKKIWAALREDPDFSDAGSLDKDKLYKKLHSVMKCKAKGKLQSMCAYGNQALTAEGVAEQLHQNIQRLASVNEKREKLCKKITEVWSLGHSRKKISSDRYTVAVAALQEWEKQLESVVLEVLLHLLFLLVALALVLAIVVVAVVLMVTFVVVIGTLRGRACAAALAIAALLLESLMSESSSGRSSVCGGTLVAPSWVLTAGHCVDTGSDIYFVGFAPGSLVGVGSLSPTRDPGARTSRVAAVYTHPDLDLSHMLYDVALVKLATPITGVQVATLAAKDYPDPAAGTKVWIIGWGDLYTEEGPSSVALREAKLPVVDRDECRELHNGTTLLDSVLCAGFNEGGRDTCTGDSGGPLVHFDKEGRAVQVGLTSYGHGCAWKESPGVYTRVSSFRQWIDDTMARVDSGAKVCGCPTKYIGNGKCNLLCFSEGCEWDRTDCAGGCGKTCNDTLWRNGVCDPGCATLECGYDNYACRSADFCSESCAESMVNNSVCDTACITSNCSFDEGDCEAPSGPIGPPPAVCHNSSIGNGECDSACFDKEHNYDGGDCITFPNCSAPLGWLGDHWCQPLYNTSECHYDAGDCLYCAPRCRKQMTNNSVCDPACYNAKCNWDGGMCDKFVGDHLCAMGCNKTQVGDGKCNPACFNMECNWDGTDCDEELCDFTGSMCLKKWLGDGICHRECAMAGCSFDSGDCFDSATEPKCAPGCYPRLHIRDDICEPECINAACGYDARDCRHLFGCAPYCLKSWVHDGECDAVAQQTEAATVAQRIVNGNPVASAAKYPWMTCTLATDTNATHALAALLEAMSQEIYVVTCGGSLIAPTWVLTAGHCVDSGRKALTQGFRPGSKVAAASLTPTDDLEAKTSTVASVYAHPDFNNDLLNNDVALLKLTEPITGVPTVEVAPSDYPDPASGTKVWAIGWGNLYNKGSSPQELNEVKLPVIPRELCRELYNTSVILDSAICTMYNEGGRDGCQGDSGGPLVHVGREGKMTQVGLTSWGNGCADAGSPGIWTRLSSFHSWIDATMAAVDAGTKVCSCPSKHIGNGYCNILCFTEECQWDGGDCNNTEQCDPGCTPAMLANSVCDIECATYNCYDDNGVCKWWDECSDQCLKSMIDNGHCDRACVTSRCRYDGDDCLSQFCDPHCPMPLINNTHCNPACNNANCSFDGGDCTVDSSHCAPGCATSSVGNGWCNIACNVSACDFDGGDCANLSQCDEPTYYIGDAYCDLDFNTSACNYDNGDCVYCAARCKVSMAHDAKCDAACYNAACNFDGGMCDKANGTGFCSVDCMASQIGDMKCDEACFNEACRWDGNDCDSDTCDDKNRNNSVCDPECLNAACGYDAPDCQHLFGCAPFCLRTWVHDGECDQECNTTSCSWDGGDCTGAAAAVAQQTEAATVAQRIVNGNPVASAAKYPWMTCTLATVTIDSYYVTCGGSLIAPTWVLTAGHCVEDGRKALAQGFRPGNTVAAASLTPTDDTEAKTSTVASVYAHPDFDHNQLNNDLALLKLTAPITGVQTVEVASSDYPDPAVGTKVWALGWGTLYSGGGSPLVLREVKLPIIAREHCRHLYNTSVILDSAICTMYKEGGRDGCQGDSGGPLVHIGTDGKMTQVGLTSWGNGCADVDLPGVWTRLSSFRSWIDATMAAVDAGTKVCSCPSKHIGNGYCNILCFTEECKWDGGDCNHTAQCGPGCTPAMLANSVCDPQCATYNCSDDNGVCKYWDECSDQCLKSMIDNGHCDKACLTSRCKYDGDDCRTQFCNHDCPTPLINNSHCNPACNTANCSFDGGDCRVDSSHCAPECLKTDVGNGWCTIACNVSACDFDGGDCANLSQCDEPKSYLGDAYCDSDYNTSACNYDNGDCVYCAAHCRLSMAHDDKCDAACYNAACNFDGGMCDKVNGTGFCSVNCKASQIGDKNCDQACFNEACRWDGYDCDRDTCDNNYECLYDWTGDGFCDLVCLNRACGYDGGDCFDLRKERCAPGCFPIIHRNNSVCEPECLNAACGYDAPDCQHLMGCAPFCLSTWVHDGECDQECNTTSCSWDGGDCAGAAAAAQQQAEATTVSQRIVNGNPVASAAKYPWMTCTPTLLGASRDGYYVSCGGTLIASTWVLTAGHCVEDGRKALTQGFRPGNTVAAASLTPTDDPEAKTSTVASVYAHPDFNHDRLNNDVALLKLAAPIKGVQAVAVAASDYPDPAAGTKLWALGWGTLYSGGGSPLALREVKLPVIPRERCRHLYNTSVILDSALCTMYNEGGRDGCQGDSGGPLVHVDSSGNAVQVGLTSWGNGCADVDLPGVWTRLSSFRSWIDATMAAVDAGTKVCSCPSKHIGNGYCNILCFTEECKWDGGDCNHAAQCSPGCTPAMLANSVCDPQCATYNCSDDNGVCKYWDECSDQCLKSMVNNTHCDRACVTSRCKYDGDDCLPQFCDPHCPTPLINNTHCNPACNTSKCNYDGGDCRVDSSHCAPECHKSFVGDRWCNLACNVSACDFDGGDCANLSQCDEPKSYLGDAYCDSDYNTSACNYDNGDCVYCAAHCRLSMAHDDKCDAACYNAACNFDGGMCDKVNGTGFCSVNCKASQIGDKNCDQACFNEACRWDGNDCHRETCDNNDECLYDWTGDGFCDLVCLNRACGYDGGDCFDLRKEQCAPGCFPIIHRNNSVCEPECLNAVCGYDAPDCQHLMGCAPFCLSTWVHDGECDKGCARIGNPGVYTRISSVRQWIDDTIKAVDRGDKVCRCPARTGCTAAMLVNDVCDPQQIYNILNSVLCPMYKVCGRDDCQGDSWGPLVHIGKDGRVTQVGLTSWGTGCEAISNPGIWTHISSFRGVQLQRGHVCSPNYAKTRIRDKTCNEDCFNEACGWDNGDCDFDYYTCDPSQHADLPQRVVNGDAVASAAKYPWMSALMSQDGDYYDLLCGASLLAPTWVLTAGHCIDGGRAALVPVFSPGGVVASSTLTPMNIKTAKKSTASAVFVHPDFDLDITMGSDVALIKLATPITGVEAVTLAASDYPDPAAETKVWSVGWGTLYTSGPIPSKLREVKLPIIDRERCRHLYNTTVIFDSVLCTMYNEGGRDGCQGDSGGPLVHVGRDGKMTQVGLTSWGTGCAAIGNPGIWTRISSFRSWIDTTMAAVDAGTKVCSCPSKHIGNGHCNLLCYSAECQWDGGDCTSKNCSAGCSVEMLHNDVCDPQCATRNCSQDLGHCQDACGPQCLEAMLNNGVCDKACLMSSGCGYDSDDCHDQFCDPQCPPMLINNTRCDLACNNSKCNYDGGDCHVDELSCAPLCAKSDVGNGWCNLACNVSACNFDGSDCANTSKCKEPKYMFGNGVCSLGYNTSNCLYDNGDCLYCAPRCSLSLLHNKHCDPACYNAACNFDGGMCDKVVGQAFCSPNCTKTQIGDGVCDEACFNEACRWDSGDCDGEDHTCDPSHMCLLRFKGDGTCDKACINVGCSFDNGDCFDPDFEPQCAPGCYPAILVNNSVCDPECLNKACGYDYADCKHLFGCAPFCLSSWIKDGQCDTECNTTGCSWDGALLNPTDAQGTYDVTCGGSLIAPSWVLTAGHCVDGGPRSLSSGFGAGGLVGAASLTPTATTSAKTSTVASVYVHPDFIDDRHDNDVALLKLSTPITEVQTVTLARSDDPDLAAGTKVWSIGWGTLNENGEEPTDLMAVKLPIISREQCRRIYNGSSVLDSVICTMYNEGGRGSCHGDSGGPLVRVGKDGQAVQVGLTNWGEGCSDPGNPEVWARVSSHRRWIDDTMARVDNGTAVCGNIGNGICNVLCYTEQCKWDGGDCASTRCAAGCTMELLANTVCDAACAAGLCANDNGHCTYDMCADQCLSNMLGNGVCETTCLNEDCEFDRGDCTARYCAPGCPPGLANNSRCDLACNNSACGYDGGDCRVGNASCALKCLRSDVGNGWCNPACNVSACNFDGGDCTHLAKCAAPSGLLGNGACDLQYNTSDCGYDNGDCVFCARRCRVSMTHNAHCDAACYNEQCKWDGDACAGLVGSDFCAPNCSKSQVGDSQCDEGCFSEECSWDHGDCDDSTCDHDNACLWSWINDGTCDRACAITAGCQNDGYDCFDVDNDACAPGCYPAVHRNDSVCQSECINAACGYDAPDCQDLFGCAPYCVHSWIRDGQCDKALVYNSSSWGVSEKCGGSLIAPGWVLTAGHCVESGSRQLGQGTRPGDLVAAGTLTPTAPETAQYRTVVGVYAHPDFDRDILLNDVALLKLAKPFTGLQEVKVVPSDYPDTPAGTKLWAIGWGSLYTESGSSAVLREVKLPTISLERCRQLYNTSDLPDSVICTLYKEGGRDGCQGDSGGPLVHVDSSGNAVQVGLTSWGNGCALRDNPGVWTRLSSFRSWIDATMAAVDAGTKVCSCPSKHIGNGFCNLMCYSEECQWDGGDCNNTECSPGCTVAMLTNKVCDSQCATFACADDNNYCDFMDECADQCLNSMVDNGHCDRACVNAGCQFDGSDCTATFCDPKCPDPLISNTFCDPACNTSKCNFDGGDCRVTNASCAPGCLKTEVGNGWCNVACNVSACGLDGGDCANLSACRAPSVVLGDGSCNKEYNTSACNYDNGDCVHCAARCRVSMAHDSKCDYQCYNAECGWDEGACAGHVGTGFCAVNCSNEFRGDGLCNEACFNEACGWDAGDCATCDTNARCLSGWTGDGFCDPACLDIECRFDRGDCFDLKKARCAPGCFPSIHRNNSVCEPECLNAACGYDYADCQHLFGCAPYCVRSWVHDGECDTECNTTACSLDGGDCAAHASSKASASSAAGPAHSTGGSSSGAGSAAKSGARAAPSGSSHGESKASASVTRVPSAWAVLVLLLAALPHAI